tara:strand:+ start:33 stop:359 length:327 start_codon:yes stop_codon:yes gene_type:complete
MKNTVKKGGDRFDKLFEVQAFDPENSKDNKIVQKRINMMMHSSQMNQWFKENILFGKDKDLTNEVIKFIINCAIAFFDEKEFLEKINFNEKEWLDALDVRVSKSSKTN